MRALKVAVIGAGSTYTPELVSGFIERINSLNVECLYLMDIDKTKLDIVAGFVSRMISAAGVNIKVKTTLSLREAVDGANYVFVQIRVGQLDARINDEKIPLKYGLLGQETTGIGGMMKGLRTIPVMMDIVSEMQKSAAKGAWLINFSNPSGMIAEAVLNNSDVNMVGLCNGPIGMCKKIYAEYGEHGVNIEFVGLNHLCFITDVTVNGESVMDQILNEGFASAELANIDSEDFSPELMRAVRALPIGYLNYYFFRDKQIKKLTEKATSRGEDCKVIEKTLLEKYKDESLTSKPVELEKRGGANYSTIAVSIVDAIENDKNEVHIVDVKNNGAYQFMDKDDVVEARCLVNRSGVHPITIGDFKNHYIIGLMQAVKAYEKLAVKAALTGDYSLALAALMVHPLIGDYHKAKSALDEMLELNKPYLPFFFNK